MTDNTLSVKPEQPSSFGNKLKALLHTYRLYWMMPIIMGLVLLTIIQFVGNSEGIRQFRYFNF